MILEQRVEGLDIPQSVWVEKEIEEFGAMQAAARLGYDYAAAEKIWVQHIDNWHDVLWQPGRVVAVTGRIVRWYTCHLHDSFTVPIAKVLPRTTWIRLMDGTLF